VSILSHIELLIEMQRPDDPLVVTPLLDERQVGEASIDVRLGHEFIVLKRSSLSHVDPTRSQDWESGVLRWQERVRISLFESFVLNPGELVLAATLEYVSVPNLLAAAVEGRSSWGRLGLVIATASTVGPGFKGCVTLELVNSGGIPLVVYPGMRIAQMVFHRLGEPATYKGKYTCPTGPQFTRVHRDPDVSSWGPKNQENSESLRQLLEIVAATEKALRK
jgi:dCTP deaminase